MTKRRRLLQTKAGQLCDKEEREKDMELKNVLEELVMLVPEAGKKLVHHAGKVVASGVVYVKEASMASDWAELDAKEAEQLEKQWQLEEEEEEEA